MQLLFAASKYAIQVDAVIFYIRAIRTDVIIMSISETKFRQLGSSPREAAQKIRLYRRSAVSPAASPVDPKLNLLNRFGSVSLDAARFHA